MMLTLRAVCLVRAIVDDVKDEYLLVVVVEVDGREDAVVEWMEKKNGRSGRGGYL